MSTRNILFLLFAICASPTIMKAQSDNTTDTINFITLIKPSPQFPGGEEKLQEYIEANLRYPSEAVKDSVTGRVYVRFIVKADGSITNVEVMKHLHPILDAEAVRVIENMPKWKPGKEGNKYVNTALVLPIRFELN